MQVLPEFENLFSATGYLGEKPTLSPTYAEYDNGKYVFYYYDNFVNSSDLAGWSILTTGLDSATSFSYSASDGLHFNNVSGAYWNQLISPYKITFPQTSIANNPYIYQNSTSKWNQPFSIFETSNQSSVLRFYVNANSNDSGICCWIQRRSILYAHCINYSRRIKSPGYNDRT